MIGGSSPDGFGFITLGGDTTRLAFGLHPKHLLLLRFSSTIVLPDVGARLLGDRDAVGAFLLARLGFGYPYFE